VAELEINDPFHGSRVIPSYTCAHCSDVVLMRPERTRQRTRCMKCMGYICEKKELCRVECTPIHKLARDHFEGPRARLVPAIMSGATTLEEAERIILGPDGQQARRS